CHAGPARPGRARHPAHRHRNGATTRLRSLGEARIPGTDDGSRAFSGFETAPFVVAGATAERRHRMTTGQSAATSPAAGLDWQGGTLRQVVAGLARFGDLPATLTLDEAAPSHLTFRQLSER